MYAKKCNLWLFVGEIRLNQKNLWLSGNVMGSEQAEISQAKNSKQCAFGGAPEPLRRRSLYQSFCKLKEHEEILGERGKRRSGMLAVPHLEYNPSRQFEIG